METDRRVLTTQAYANHGPLAARASIYQWQRDRVDLPALVVERLAGTRGVVVDAGCGLGTYVDRLRAECPHLRPVGLDLSAGMRPEVVGDIQRLPMRTGSAAAALAMHMLYHVPDVSAALAELRRVVRPGGLLLVSTNAHDDKHEMDDLWVSVLTDLTGSPPTARPDPAGSSGRFDFEDAWLIGDAFKQVTLDAFRRATLVPRVAPVVAFVDSTRAFAEPLLPGGVTWQAYLSRAEQHIADAVQRDGAFRLSNHVGLLTCR